MYKEILKLYYADAHKKFTDSKSHSSIANVITLNNKEDIDSFSNDSQIIIYYDVISGEPLTLIERIDADSVNMLEAKGKVEVFNRESVNYVAEISESAEFVDIIVVHKNLTICS